MHNWRLLDNSFDLSDQADSSTLSWEETTLSLGETT